MTFASATVAPYKFHDTLIEWWTSTMGLDTLQNLNPNTKPNIETLTLTL